MMCVLTLVVTIVWIINRRFFAMVATMIIEILIRFLFVIRMISIRFFNIVYIVGIYVCPRIRVHHVLKGLVVPIFLSEEFGLATNHFERKDFIASVFNHDHNRWGIAQQDTLEKD